MLLVDSGGQYDIGTTDVTRTMHLGEPTAWQRECFTRVLKGHIGLATAVFPEGTPHISPVSPLHLPYISPISPRRAGATASSTTSSVYGIDI